MMRFVAMLAVVVAGCGSVDGFPCEKADASQCDGARVAYCERASSGGLKWRSYDCPVACNPLGAVMCDWNNAKAGEACPAVLAAQTRCPGDGRLLICLTTASGGAWVDAPCPRCVAGAETSAVLNCSGGSGVCSCN